MKIIETGPREIGFVLWGHCQNLLDDPRSYLIASQSNYSSYILAQTRILTRAFKNMAWLCCVKQHT